ncbi:hypothetical protein [Rothia sp. HMSC073B08]|uniref:hypothetical protein n=1 Tax=Rothia sp. HMSC073B08 TaxID=1739388 RepID=UPI000ACBC306|nr:hypothetical protein [Rothia sp. HMSC073B08]
MTTTVPQMPQAPQKTQPPQGAPSSVNNPAFNSQQVAQSAVHPAQFAQPVYVLPEQENTHTQGWIIAMASVIIGVLGLISVFVLNYLTGGGASLLLGLTGWVLAIASRHRGHMRVAGVALGVMNMLLGILTVPFEMLLLILVMMHV